MFSRDFISYIKTRKTESTNEWKNANLFNDISKFVKPKELDEIVDNLHTLLVYLLENDKFILPDDVKIFRAGKINAFDRTEYYPLLRSSIQRCAPQSHSFEPIWFGIDPNAAILYFNLKHNEEGILSCRQIRSITEDNTRVNLLVNLSSNNNSGPHNSWYIEKELQRLINNVILVPIVRCYTDNSISKNHTTITTDQVRIDASLNSVVFINTVIGYHCDAFYSGGTINDVINAWSEIDGKRQSIYNPDRIQCDTLFYFFEIIENIFNKYVDAGHTIIAGIDTGSTINVNLLGWKCEKTPTNSNSIFHAEIALNSRFFQVPERYRNSILLVILCAMIRGEHLFRLMKVR